MFGRTKDTHYGLITGKEIDNAVLFAVKNVVQEWISIKHYNNEQNVDKRTGNWFCCTALNNWTYCERYLIIVTFIKFFNYTNEIVHFIILFAILLIDYVNGVNSSTFNVIIISTTISILKGIYRYLAIMC